MSQRTIVEFNHDFAHDVEDNAEEVGKRLRRAMSSGDPKEWEKLAQFGIQRVVQAHHSDKRSAIVGGYEYPIG